MLVKLLVCFIQGMVHQFLQEVPGVPISSRRLEMYARQVIPREQLLEIMKLQENKANNFQEILSNLLFSANNPFLPELP